MDEHFAALFARYEQLAGWPQVPAVSSA